MFEFRNSVEHYYPQHPEKYDLDEWSQEKLDRFGNLALLQRNINAHFSNLPPLNKKAYIDKYNERNRGTMSLKLRRMASLTETYGDWQDNVCADHGKEMLNILREACGLTIEQ